MVKLIFLVDLRSLATQVFAISSPNSSSASCLQETSCCLNYGQLLKTLFRSAGSGLLLVIRKVVALGPLELGRICL